VRKIKQSATIRTISQFFFPSPYLLKYTVPEIVVFINESPYPIRM